MIKANGKCSKVAFLSGVGGKRAIGNAYSAGFGKVAGTKQHWLQSSTAGPYSHGLVFSALNEGRF